MDQTVILNKCMALKGELEQINQCMADVNGMPHDGVALAQLEQERRSVQDQLRDATEQLRMCARMRMQMLDNPQLSNTSTQHVDTPMVTSERERDLILANKMLINQMANHKDILQAIERGLAGKMFSIDGMSEQLVELISHANKHRKRVSELELTVGEMRTRLDIEQEANAKLVQRVSELESTVVDMRTWLDIEQEANAKLVQRGDVNGDAIVEITHMLNNAPYKPGCIPANILKSLQQLTDEREHARKKAADAVDAEYTIAAIYSALVGEKHDPDDVPTQISTQIEMIHKRDVAWRREVSVLANEIVGLKNGAAELNVRYARTVDNIAAMLEGNDEYDRGYVPQIVTRACGTIQSRIATHQAIAIKFADEAKRERENVEKLDILAGVRRNQLDAALKDVSILREENASLHLKNAQSWDELCQFRKRLDEFADQRDQLRDQVKRLEIANEHLAARSNDLAPKLTEELRQQVNLTTVTMRERDGLIADITSVQAQLKARDHTITELIAQNTQLRTSVDAALEWMRVHARN